MFEPFWCISLDLGSLYIPARYLRGYRRVSPGIPGLPSSNFFGNGRLEWECQVHQAEQRLSETQSSLDTWRDSTRLEFERAERAAQTQIATLERALASARDSQQEALRAVEQRISDTGTSVRAWMQEKQAAAVKPEYVAPSPPGRVSAA